MRVSTTRVLGLPILLGFASGALGCLEKEAQDPGEVVREETVNRIAPPSRASSRTVRCGCDADGDLHISAPQGSRVSRPEDATHPAEAQVVLADDAPVPLRRTRSLGFIGDAPLTQGRSYGGPWNVPDALLPAHRHIEPRYGSTYGYRTHGYAYGGAMTYGGISAGRVAPGWR